MPTNHKSKIILSTSAIVFLADRLTKAWVMKSLWLDQSITVIRGFFDITYVRNVGSAFGLFSMARHGFRVPFLITANIVAMALLLFFIRKTRPGDRLMVFALALILGGALGNFTDRILYGYVIDFIYWHVGEHYWPAFNIADSAITCGVVLLGFETLIRKKTFEPSTGSGG